MIVRVVAYLVLQMFSGNVESCCVRTEGSVRIHCDRSMVPKQLFSQLSCGCAKCGECVDATFLINVVLWIVSAGAVCWSLSRFGVIVLCGVLGKITVLGLVFSLFIFLLLANCKSHSG